MSDFADRNSFTQVTNIHDIPDFYFSWSEKQFFLYETAGIEMIASSGYS